MSYEFFVIDTFSEKILNGTTAAVFFVDDLANLELFQNIAMEINTTETVFVKELAHGDFEIVCFCPIERGIFFGNSLFAAAQVILEKKNIQFPFNFICGNKIYKISREESGEITIRFSAVELKKVTAPASLSAALNGELIVAIAEWNDWLVVEIRSPKKIFYIEPSMDIVSLLKYKKIILTADTHHEIDVNYDFCSKILAHRLGVYFDILSAKSHVILAEYWRERICKKEFVGYHYSKFKEGYAKVSCYDNEFVSVSGFCKISFFGSLNV